MTKEQNAAKENSEMVSKCRNCQFWIFREQYSGEPPEQREIAPDMITGTCHRNAPRPSVGAFESEMLKMISIVAFHYAKGEERETQFEDYEEAVWCGMTAWPQTFAEDWCGEFRRRNPADPGDVSE